MRLKQVGLAAAAAFLLSGAGFAADDGPADREAKFREWDKSGDGVLQRNEYPGHPGNFRALDLNGDNELSLDEFVHRAGARAPEGTAAEPPAAEFDAKDHDKSGTISRAEWPDAWEFDRRDRNRDGVLTRNEYNNPREVSSRDDEFRRLDANNDGFISRSEWKGRRTAFDQHDRNEDGLISRAEFTRPVTGRDGALRKE